MTARRIRLDVAYDGTHFAGWQFQPGQRTVQGVLEQTLSELQGGRAVSVRGAGRTEAGVHARKDALSKTYRYRLDLSRHGDPFEAHYALHYPYRLDPELLERALRMLPGRRDWSGFAASNCDKLDRVLQLTAVDLEQPEPERLSLTFSADGFLQHMVRNIVGTLLEIGGRRMPLETIEEVLATGDRDRAGPTAGARGLCLVQVVYPGPEPPSS